MMTQSCPECGKILSAHARVCRCGWKLFVKLEAPSVDKRCAYQVNDRRCPLPGTVCHRPYSKEGPWYCSEHARCDDPKLGEAVLRHAEENYHAILAARCDWRDVAIAERMGVSTTHITRNNQPTQSTALNGISPINPGETECF